ncbi:DNA/RNA non-specific endonuclease [Bacillus massiliglaciei]|uniref:DNA/RNA non-specific endonuclease n=1 Tax=Bacillus massiliglaciei TaxID=1816693 RepID=UPI000AEF997D|nr:DNA/RNA non-specific endonuclease [Bacillus massiliglaciei]
MESTQSRFKHKMEELWDLYESKVKKFENTDDEYANKAAAVQDRYTNFSEGASEVVSVTAEGAWNFVKGFGVAAWEILKGSSMLIIDTRIISLSSMIPDVIEPPFLKKASDKRIESAKEMLELAIEDPAIILESMAQSISDTAEKEGIMYASGSAATSFIPYAGQAKYLKLLKAGKGINKASGTRSAISKKSTESVQGVGGIKKENAAWPSHIKNGGQQYIQDVTHFFRQTLMPNPPFQLSTANQAPINIMNRSTIENRMDSIVSASPGKVEGKGAEGATKGTGNRLAGESDIKTLVGRGEQYTNGRKNRLKSNIWYKTGEYNYFYETDSAGRIVKFETENLQLTLRTDRLSHSKNTPGKVKGQDHAGHLAGDRFGGSPKIDNLVSQLSDVNLKQYKKIEDEWAAALKETPPKEVTINLQVIYSRDNVRPEKFLVKYKLMVSRSLKSF